MARTGHAGDVSASIDPDTAAYVELKDIQDLCVNQRVTVTVKVVEEMEPTSVTSKAS